MPSINQSVHSSARRALEHCRTSSNKVRQRILPLFCGLIVVIVVSGDRLAYASEPTTNSQSEFPAFSGAPGFDVLDWIVLASYAIGMMCIGWYFSRAKSVDEYLLGGRHMSPVAVGISLFSTLMSTLTYLAYPGEVIKHGPLFFSGMLAYPIVYLTVSRFIIPAFMRMRVTSAYEILEDRFGVSIRMFGSSIFLLLRFQWMALLVYATSSAIIVPLFGLSSAWIPLICVVICLFTVVYTAMGGIRAVVVTDVVQTAIMIIGVIASLIYVTYSLGGVDKWWPTAWAPHWDPPSFFFDPDSRIAVGPALISTFAWYVCTAGSDQMAVQRYLATRDLRAARQMFAISLLCDVFAAVLLALMGLALMAFYTARPEVFGGSVTLQSESDQLMSEFIARALPAGLGGLVIAGILSAAMDSLSSGINSSCSVITADWLERFGRASTGSGEGDVRRAKVVSWVVGGVVVVLSLFANTVSGSLLEKCFTIVNVLTAPLFVLFFMAVFVSWATTFGAWVAGTVSILVAVTMAYTHLTGLSFLWITPASFVSGAVCGSIASCFPVGSRCPMLETEA